MKKETTFKEYLLNNIDAHWSLSEKFMKQNEESGDSNTQEQAIQDTLELFEQWIKDFYKAKPTEHNEFIETMNRVFKD